MVWEEYYKKYIKYKKIYSEICKLENEKIEILGMVDLQSSSTNNDSSNSSSKKDKMTDYLVQVEKIENRLSNKQLLIEELKEKLSSQKEELKESKEDLDKVYLYKYIEHLKYYQIASKIGYCKTKTYDLINEIDKKMVEIKIAEKNGKN